MNMQPCTREVACVPHMGFSVRVVGGQAHLIKNRLTDVAKACHSLSSIHRWAVTGTPLQNSLQDLFSLFLFLQLEPWCQLRWWRRVISEPYDKGDPRAMATLQCVRASLGVLMLRWVYHSPLPPPLPCLRHTTTAPRVSRVLQCA